MKESAVIKREEQIIEVLDIESLVKEYVQLKEIKKEVEERLKRIEEVLRPYTEREGNLVFESYEIGWFSRREGEVADMKRFIEVAILRGIEEKVLKPVITQVKSLKVKELMDLLVEKEKKIFSMKKIV